MSRKVDKIYTQSTVNFKCDYESRISDENISLADEYLQGIDYMFDPISETDKWYSCIGLENNDKLKKILECIDEWFYVSWYRVQYRYCIIWVPILNTKINL